MPSRPSTSKHGTGNETAFAPRNAPTHEEQEQARESNATGQGATDGARTRTAGQGQGQQGKDENENAPPYDKQDEAKNETTTDGTRNETKTATETGTAWQRSKQADPHEASYRQYRQRLLKTFSPFYLRV